MNIPNLKSGKNTGLNRKTSFHEELKENIFYLYTNRSGTSSKNDGFVKSPSAVRQAHGPEQSRRAALRFILRHCGVLYVRLIPQDSRALPLELFTVPSSLTTSYVVITIPLSFSQKDTS